MTGPSEFVLDFLQTIGRPHRVASRVILPHPVMPQFITALRTNLELYEQRFGPAPKPLTPPQEGRRPTPQEIYDDLKLPDEILSGVYSNGVMIGHGANEFSLDFLTSFFPQSAISARIYLAAGQVPRLLESLQNAVLQLQQRQTPPSIPPGTGVADVIANTPETLPEPSAPRGSDPTAAPHQDDTSDDDTPPPDASSGGSSDEPPPNGPSTGPKKSPPSGDDGGFWV